MMLLLNFPGVSLVFGRGDYLPTAAFFICLGTGRAHLSQTAGGKRQLKFAKSCLENSQAGNTVGLNNVRFANGEEVQK